jgi:transposase-like protein
MRILRSIVAPSTALGIVKLRSYHREWQKGGMNDTRSTLRYPGFRFPAEIIGHAVWLYHRFTLSFRDIEDLLAERGIIVTHETIRQWCLRFGQEYANSIRRRRPQPGDKWHLDEVFIKVCGETHYLWRAVVQDGNVLDILVQSQRNAKAATHFFKKLLKGLPPSMHLADPRRARTIWPRLPRSKAMVTRGVTT